MLVVYHFPKPPLELSWVLFCYYVVMSYSCISWMLVFISLWHDIVFMLLCFICIFYYINLWSLAGHKFICLLLLHSAFIPMPNKIHMCFKYHYTGGYAIINYQKGEIEILLTLIEFWWLETSWLACILKE